MNLIINKNYDGFRFIVMDAGAKVTGEISRENGYEIYNELKNAYEDGNHIPRID